MAVNDDGDDDEGSNDDADDGNDGDGDEDDGEDHDDDDDDNDDVQVVLQSYYQLADSERCVAESRQSLHRHHLQQYLHQHHHLQENHHQHHHLQLIIIISNRIIRSYERKNPTRGGLLHELFHVFGVMHTQKRADRDRS